MEEWGDTLVENFGDSNILLLFQHILVEKDEKQMESKFLLNKNTDIYWAVEKNHCWYILRII